MGLPQPEPNEPSDGLTQDDPVAPPAEEPVMMPMPEPEPEPDPELVIDPASVTLVVSDRSMPATAQFQASLLGDPAAVDATWYIDGNLVSVDENGAVSTTGMVGGEVTLRATYGNLEARATVVVQVSIAEQLDPAPGNPDNAAALDGVPEPDPGAELATPDATRMLYPFEDTVMPRGLSSPVLQFSPGSLTPQDARVTLRSEHFEWSGSFQVEDGARPQVTVPQDVWDAALRSSGGERLSIEVVKAVDGVAYGPASTSIVVADASLGGAVYYMTYEGASLGLWSVRPGQDEPATHIVQGCAVCHSASSNGTRLAAGSENAGLGGIYTMATDGTANRVAAAPGGLGGDTRGISYATFTPDGNYVMRSQNNFWGGVNQRAWRVDDVQGTLVEAEVIGLGAEVSAYLPAVSHDSSRYAFTNGAGELMPAGTPGRSLSVMDLQIDEAAGEAGSLEFSNRQVVLDNGPDGSLVKFATFMPDPDLLVFQEGESYHTGYGEMLPTWGPTSNYRTATGRLLSLSLSDGAEPVRLERLNRGLREEDADRNYEPFALPIAAGGYYWVVFTSIREYGNTHVGNEVRKQLWVAAMSPNAAPGEDPSHPPFYLPNQTETANERGFWALEPCRADGQSCESGDQCCNGFCRLEDAADPAAGSVCMPPEELLCSQLRERCEAATDCCDVAVGAECLGGFCDIPAPPPPPPEEEEEEEEPPPDPPIVI